MKPAERTEKKAGGLGRGGQDSGVDETQRDGNEKSLTDSRRLQVGFDNDHVASCEDNCTQVLAPFSANMMTDMKHDVTVMW